MARATGRASNRARSKAKAQAGSSRNKRSRSSSTRSTSVRRGSATVGRSKRKRTNVVQLRGRKSAQSSSRSRRALTTTDHDEIQRWAEERSAQPACVRGTGGESDVGMIRLDFPGYSGAQSLQPISWDDWFRKFDESNLALIYEETTARGQKSNFNKLIGRETADKRQRGQSHASRRHPERASGQTKSASSRKKAA